MAISPARGLFRPAPPPPLPPPSRLFQQAPHLLIIENTEQRYTCVRAQRDIINMSRAQIAFQKVRKSEIPLKCEFELLLSFFFFFTLKTLKNPIARELREIFSKKYCSTNNTRLAVISIESKTKRKKSSSMYVHTYHGDDGLDSLRRGLLARGRLDEGATQIFEGEPRLGRVLGFLPVRGARRTAAAAAAAALHALTAVRQRPFLA